MRRRCSPAGEHLPGMVAGPGFKHDEMFLRRLPNVKVISNFGVGYDSVDARWCGQNGVVVTNTPGVLTEEVADLTLGLLLSTIRQLPQADQFVRRGDWLKGSFPLTTTLRERKVGILALGRIGKAIARGSKASAWRSPTTAAAARPMFPMPSTRH